MKINDLKNTAHKYLIRDAKLSDLDDICVLGSLLNTMNLPAKKAELEKVIINSERSFSLEEKDSTKRAFLFVLQNQEGRVIGTSQVFAKHGSLDSPHCFFEVKSDERYSKTLNKYFRHRTLRLCQSFDGPSEVGSLVLEKKYRSLPEKLGRNLSYVRFLFMAMKPNLFSNSVLAELLPPLGQGFESHLWDAIGRHFTGMDYYEADMISRYNKEFIKTLFPSSEIYVSLLPPQAQDVIGQVGRNSKGAAELLSKIGFRYSHRVDPFDGGPHFEADLSDITLIKNCMHASVISQKNTIPHHGDDTLRVGLVGSFNPQKPSGERFISTLAAYYFDQEEKTVNLHAASLDTLKTKVHEKVSIIDLTPWAVN